MSETIPDDILSAAAAVVDRGYDTGLIDAVAAALVAERTRCGKIAQEVEAHCKTVADHCAKERESHWRLAQDACSIITARIAAIRTPSTGEEQ